MIAAQQRLLPGKPREAGITLIELLVYMVLAVLVLLIVGGLLINTLKTQRTVRAASEATTAGQLVSQSIGRGVRNASAIQFTAPSADTQLIRVRTAVAGDNADLRVPAGWMCQAWYYGAGEIRTKTSTTAIPTPTATNVSTWTLLATGVQPLPVSPATVPTTTTPVLSGSGGQVTLRTQVSTGDGKPALIRTSWSSRQPVPTTTPTPTPTPTPTTTTTWGTMSLPCF